MKLLSIVVPSYNASAYLHYCVESLVIGGDLVEILIINDGSTDDTQKVAEHLAMKYPEQVKSIFQENKGHGGAVNRGINEAKGLYLKVVDSDDWVDARAYLKVLETLNTLCDDGKVVDAFVSNFVYEKEGQARKKIMRYENVLPQNCIFTWNDIGRFKKGKYLLMHSLIYRTDLLRQVDLQLPEHTFYVDNLFVFIPLKAVKTLYYLPVDFYRYLIGRKDQSVNEKVMIERIDQQLLVNRLMIDQLDLTAIDNIHLKHYLFHYLEIITVISSTLLNQAGSTEHLLKKKELWLYIRENNPAVFKQLRRSILAQLSQSSNIIQRKISALLYHVMRKLYGFN